MLRLVDKMTVPAGGWKFWMGGHWIQAADYNRLAGAVLKIRGPSLDFEQGFQDEFCRQNLKAVCQVCVPITNETRKLTAGDALRFLKVLREWAGVGGELVSQETAEARAEICAGCKYNVSVEGCSICQGVASKITEFIGARATRFDEQLDGCAVCGCVNKAQIHLPLEVLQKGVTPEMEFPDWCWKQASFVHNTSSTA